MIIVMHLLVLPQEFINYQDVTNLIYLKTEFNTLGNKILFKNSFTFMINTQHLTHSGNHPKLLKPFLIFFRKHEMYKCFDLN